MVDWEREKRFSSGRGALTGRRKWRTEGAGPVPVPVRLRAQAGMKLLTHNLLSSHVRGVGPRGFPLRIQATEVRVSPVDFNPDFVTRMIPKMEWTALVEAAESLGHLSELPRELAEGYEKDEEFLRKVHHVLLEVEVVEGTLQCPESGRLFPISRGIPNMLLSDEEAAS